MSENYSMDEAVLDEVTEEVNDKRPMFLTVLCILTWIGSGIAAIGALFNLLTFSRATEQMKNSGVKFKELSNELDNVEPTGEAGEEIAKNMVRGMAEGMDNVIEWTTTLNWINLGVAILCVLAAYLMWQLKRTGYFLYTAATIVGVAAPIALMGSNFFSLISVFVGGFFGLIFIILYGVNFKHLK